MPIEKGAVEMASCSHDMVADQQQHSQHSLKNSPSRKAANPASACACGFCKPAPR